MDTPNPLEALPAEEQAKYHAGDPTVVRQVSEAFARAYPDEPTGEQVADAQASADAAVEAGLGELRQAWGDAFDLNGAAARRAAERLEDPELRREVLEGPLGREVAVVKALAAGRIPPTASPAWAEAEIRRILHDPEQSRRYLTGDPYLGEWMRTLFALAHGAAPEPREGLSLGVDIAGAQ